MKDLINKIRNRQVILFVGAGVSATIGLPTWSQLMDYVADSLGVPNPIQETILESRGIVPIVGEDVDPTVNLENFLKELCEKSKKH